MTQADERAALSLSQTAAPSSACVIRGHSCVSGVRTSVSALVEPPRDCSTAGRREESSLASAREQVLSVRAAHDLGSRGPPLGADLDPGPLGAAELVGRQVELADDGVVRRGRPDQAAAVGPVVAEVRGRRAPGPRGC